jgi:hypothetical protein
MPGYTATQGNRKVQSHFAFDQSSEWGGSEATTFIGIDLNGIETFHSPGKWIVCLDFAVALVSQVGNSCWAKLWRARFRKVSILPSAVALSASPITSAASSSPVTARFLSASSSKRESRLLHDSFS